MTELHSKLEKIIMEDCEGLSNMDVLTQIAGFMAQVSIWIAESQAKHYEPKSEGEYVKTASFAAIAALAHHAVGIIDSSLSRSSEDKDEK